MNPLLARCFLKNVQELDLNFIKLLFFKLLLNTPGSFHSPLFINCNSKTVIYHNPKDFGVNIKIEFREGENLKKSSFFDAPCIWLYFLPFIDQLLFTYVRVYCKDIYVNIFHFSEACFIPLFQLP